MHKGGGEGEDRKGDGDKEWDEELIKSKMGYSKDRTELECNLIDEKGRNVVVDI
jgi:hypothetical protein